MATTTTIPKQHYVTIQYRKDASTESGLLGFSSPYTKDAAFEKRRATQESWAYGGYGHQFEIDADGSITPLPTAKIDTMALFTTKCYPQIHDNTPTAGFEIAKSVRRSGGWGGSGNVVWRIADPRGFELEIGSENFAKVLDCTTIVNGVIQGECVWGRDSGKNVLLPVVSDVYQAAFTLTEKTNNKVSLKEVKVGDIVEILSSNVADDDQTCQYLGKYFFVSPEQADSNNCYYYSGVFKFSNQIERYLLKSVKNGTYFVLSTPKVSKVVTPIGTPLNKVDVAKEVTALLGPDFSIDGVPMVTLVSPSKVVDITTELVPYTGTIKGGNWPSTESNDYSHRAEAVICKLDGKMWLASSERVGNNYPYEFEPTLIEIYPDTTAGLSIVKVETKTKHGTGYWVRENVEYNNNVRRDFDIDKVDKYSFMVTANGITGKLTRLGYF